MLDSKKTEYAKAVVFGLGAGLLFYILGGVAAPFFVGITAEVAGAFGFLIGTGAKLLEE